VVKTHQLTYSSSNTLYAKFDRDQNQHFVIQSRIAKEYLDHFQSRIEEVDIYVDDENSRLIWNGYTEGFVGDDNRIFLL
jgi:Rad9